MHPAVSPESPGHGVGRTSRDRASVTELDTANTLDSACQDPGIAAIVLEATPPKVTTPLSTSIIQS